MLEIMQFLLPTKLLGLLVKPVVRLVLGFVAIPLAKLLLHRVIRIKDLDEELEKDISEWIRGSLLLLIATGNMEATFFHFVPIEWREDHAWLLGARLLLAIGVIEGMPDQALFSIIHPGPPRLEIDRRRILGSLAEYAWPFLKGMFCKYLNRSSSVLAILTVFLPGHVGWVCYGLAIANYLIIGLVSSKDKALNVLQKFDEAVAERRHELVEELDEPPDLTPVQRVIAAERSGAFPNAE